MNKDRTKSLILIAEEILANRKEGMNMYDLYELACTKKDVSKYERENNLAQFYTDMISSARFVYLGDNEWDLKANQDVTLWEKDGSYYKEYTKVDVPVIEEETPKASPVKPTKKEPVEEIVEPVVQEVVEPVVEEVIADTVKEVEELPTKKEPVKEGADVLEIIQDEEEEVADFDEELFDDFDDDFDEEKYNEYMDTYEDQYDD